MADVPAVDAASTIFLLTALQVMDPDKRIRHVFLDNAGYRHAKLVREGLNQPGCGSRLHFIPACCPHLDPMERLWGRVHKQVTHNRSHATFKEFGEAVLASLRKEVPREWRACCDQVAGDFRGIDPKDFRVLV